MVEKQGVVGRMVGGTWPGEKRCMVWDAVHWAANTGIGYGMFSFKICIGQSSEFAKAYSCRTLFSRPFNYEISRFGLILLLASRMFTHTSSSVGSVHTLSALSLALPPQGPWSILFWISFEKIRVLAGVRTFWGCSLYPYLMTLFMYWHSSFGDTHRCTLCQWNVYFCVPSIPRPTIIILCCSTSPWMRLHYCEWYVCRISSRVLGLP